MQNEYIHLQQSASIQPRTSPPKFGKRCKYEKIFEKGAGNDTPEPRRGIFAAVLALPTIRGRIPEVVLYGGVSTSHHQPCPGSNGPCFGLELR